MISRPLVAACASCLTTAAFYPVDTWKLARQLNKPFIVSKANYNGLLTDITGSFVATGTYFSVYENLLLKTQNTALSSFIGISVSVFFITPFDIRKKRKQAKTNNLVQNIPVTTSFKNVYFTGLLKNAPKNIVKYIAYENCLYMFRHIGNAWRGALSAAIASFISTILTIPVDIIRNNLIFKLPLPTKFGLYYKGIVPNIIYSTLSNSLGHCLLENFSPRI